MLTVNHEQLNPRNNNYAAYLFARFVQEMTTMQQIFLLDLFLYGIKTLAKMMHDLIEIFQFLIESF